MRLTIDFDKKTVEVYGEVSLADLHLQLKRVLHREWKEYRIVFTTPLVQPFYPIMYPTLPSYPSIPQPFYYDVPNQPSLWGNSGGVMVPISDGHSTYTAVPTN